MEPMSSHRSLDWIHDPVRGWPKCKFCGLVMERAPESGPYNFVAYCPIEGHERVKFWSCRYGHRDCALEGIRSWRDPFEKRPEEYAPNPWKGKARVVVLSARALRYRRFRRARRRKIQQLRRQILNGLAV